MSVEERLLPELLPEIYPLIGARLPAADHVRFVAATHVNGFLDGIPRDEYAKSVQSGDKIIGTLLHSATTSDEKFLLREALFASRSRTALGITKQVSPSTNGARLPARRFFDSLKRADAFVYLAARGQGDPHVWSLLRAAWTRRSSDQARLQRPAVDRVLRPEHRAELDAMDAAARTLHAMPQRELISMLAPLYEAMQPRSTVERFLAGQPREYPLLLAQALVRRAADAAVPTERKVFINLAVSAVLDHAQLPGSPREKMLLLRSVAALTSNRSQHKETMIAQFHILEKLQSDPELQSHEFRRIMGEISAERTIHLDIRSYTDALASLCDPQLRRESLHAYLESNHSDNDLQIFLRAPKLAEITRDWLAAKGLPEPEPAWRVVRNNRLT